MELAFGDYQLKFRTPSGAGVRDRWAPPPQAADFSEEYKKVLEAWEVLWRRSAAPPGLTALRAAEPEANPRVVGGKPVGGMERDIANLRLPPSASQPVAALQRCSLALALFPGSFGLELFL
ncbi:unnamed protein product [Effrenium voratum]|nr:unnamed protein product [Effrenium voratum]